MTISTKSDEEKLKILLEWKKLYNEALIDSLTPSGDVLEVGFGNGFAANKIQSFHPKSHTILESNPQLFQNAKEWSEKHSNVTLIPGKWESALSKLGTFDAIFFNDYPLECDMAIMDFLFPEENRKVSSDAKDLLKGLEEQMSKITAKFSDKDIDDFYQKIGQHNSKELPKFLKILKEKGNISEAQYTTAVKKYHLDTITEETTNTNIVGENKKSTPDVMFQFLEECLKKHMKKGSRFSAFLNSQTSKFDDSHFFDHVITNAYVDYKENSVSIQMADKTRNAVIMVVEKVS